jgi:hypothetical protein
MSTNPPPWLVGQSAVTAALGRVGLRTSRGEAIVRKATILLIIAMLVAACGGDSDSTDSSDEGSSASNSSDAPDPCTLSDDSVFETYFGGDPGDGERSEAGPIMGCSWRDANSNSLLIQVATDFDIFRPDPCDGCVDLSFGDDGFASPSLIQSTAKVIEGSLWVSVTTTGFGDDAESISDLLETVFQNAVS